MPVFFASLLSVLTGGWWFAEPIIQHEHSYFTTVAAHDVPLRKPRPGEWLYEHQESGQTLAQYQQLGSPRPDSVRRIIYLELLGRFTPRQRQAVAETRDYLAAFFQLPVVLLPDTARAPMPAGAQRRAEGHVQWLAPYLTEQRLRGHRPADGLALMAFTAQDLYPKADWNYVFGLASYSDRVGVTSLYRLQGAHLTAANYQRCLQRLIQISSHELGHMLNLRHCTHARCTMNGTNSLAETDATPNRLCSECQMKLYWAYRYDNRQRLQQLTEFFRRRQLRRDFALARRDARSLRY